jgi:hypothetical protein
MDGRDGQQGTAHMEFPTLAQRALAEFTERRERETVSLSTIADAHGAHRADQRALRVFVFPDDSRIEAHGTGASMVAEATLP